MPDRLAETLRCLVSGEAPWPLCCWGSVGVGKTCAALVLLDHAGGEYWTADGLAGALIDAQHDRLWWSDYGSGVAESRKIGPTQLWKVVVGAPLVVIDELGCRGSVSEFQYQVVKRVLDERLGKPLVCLANVPPGTLAGMYDDLVSSRLVAGTVLALPGDDRRLRARKEPPREA